LLKRQFLSSCALWLAAAGCIAQQTAPAAPAAAPVNAAPAMSATLTRKIEVMIRSELSVPPQYEMTIGTRQKSDMEGYDTIPVTFSLPGRSDHSQTMDFLLSKDGNTLARLSKWDIGPDPGSELPTQGRPVRGTPLAKVTIVNFDDLECPYCARMHSVFFPETLDRYKGLVKFVYMDYPLLEIHPWAMHAAVDANCLADENATAYWNYVDYLHTHGEDVSGPENDPAKASAMLDKLAEQQGALEQVDAAKLAACVAKQDKSKVEAEMKAGDKLGVNATPTFFVNGERWAGQLDEAQLWVMIDRALKAEGIAPPVVPQKPPPPPVMSPTTP
jgi:protein-disulfide isomerase